jgi:hypothetical protein
VACLFAVLGIPRGASAAAMSHDGAIDVTAALAEAGRAWDLENEDAVFLLESARFIWSPDGRLREERHRLVWISTDLAQETYADLRVPWDAERQALTVKALRVLRGGRWIEARPTAVVETTPFALRNAPDYTSVRETMLLHDGVELPCVLECAYVIEDVRPFRAGFEGLWTFRRADPALESRLVLEGPDPLRSYPADGAPEGERGAATGMTAVTYVMKRLPPAPNPAGEDPAAGLPRVSWSTFATWGDLGSPLTAAFRERLVLDEVLRDSLDKILEGSPNDVESARRIAAFVHGRMRRIDYAPAWLAPLARPAARVFDSGYGGDPDLAILAGALFREAGFRVEPAFAGRGHGSVDEGIPTLARLGAPGLWIASPQVGDLSLGVTVAAFWDPATGTLIHRGVGLTGRALWVTDVHDAPAVLGARGTDSWSRTHLDLRWNAETKTWSGAAWFEAGGIANPHDAMAQGDGATRKALAAALGRVMEGLEVVSYDPVALGPEHLSTRVEVTTAEVERDARGRVALALGPSAGGIWAMLPPDAILHEERRETPVRGVSAEHSVRVRLELGGLQIVRLPEPGEIANEAGAYRLDVERGETAVVYTTSVRVVPEVPAAAWPALRALLLAERDPARRTILLR